MGADTKAGGALEDGDHSLLEDGCERGGALSSNIVPAETANEGQSMNVAGEQGCQRALTQKQTLCGGGGALERGHGASLEPLAQLSDALGGIGASAVKLIEAAELVVGQAAKQRRSVNGR